VVVVDAGGGRDGGRSVGLVVRGPVRWVAAVVRGATVADGFVVSRLHDRDAVALIETRAPEWTVVGTGPSCTRSVGQVLDRPGRRPGLLDTNVSQVLPASLNAMGAALLPA
jgi:hypothetical protein